MLCSEQLIGATHRVIFECERVVKSEARVSVKVYDKAKYHAEPEELPLTFR